MHKRNPPIHIEEHAVKTLLIMRHAKSDYPAHIDSDFERPLNKRGYKDVPRIARLLRAYGPVPQVVLSSPAVRARQTAEGLATELGGEIEVRFDENLYLAPPAALSAAASQLPQAASCALVVAHNPGLEEWIGVLSGSRVVLPTAGLAAVALGGDSWAQLDQGGGALLWYVVPKLLKALQL